MKTVREYIQPSGSRVSLRLEAVTGRIFNAYRYVNGADQTGWLGWSKKDVDGVINDWIAYEERRGSRKTTDKWERTHCPWCEQNFHA